ncbi:MAG TPA: Hsp20/alpha crystallin family protein [Tepidisphaeraceae bacterium]|nr:Hsp20/alpha crystallin family protein [Tepidisphaeraceae bacterium]
MSVTLAPDKPYHTVGRQMTKLIEQIQKGYCNFAPGEAWAPSVNLYETEASYLVCVDLAGVEKDEIEITVHERALNIRGKREVPRPGPYDQRVRIHLMEIDHGSFSREVELPHDVQEDRINAHYTNGLLWIELPKT